MKICLFYWGQNFFRIENLSSRSWEKRIWSSGHLFTNDHLYFTKNITLHDFKFTVLFFLVNCCLLEGIENPSSRSWEKRIWSSGHLFTNDHLYFTKNITLHDFKFTVLFFLVNCCLLEGIFENLICVFSVCVFFFLARSYKLEHFLAQNR